MLGIAAGVVALLVTLCAFLYFGINSLLLWKLTIEGPETRRVLGLPLLPAFLQNTGIPLAILGFSLLSTELVVVSGLLISLGILLTTEKSICLHPAVEATLLRLAIVTLASVGLFYSLF
ncbi:MAG: hypothetical protein IIA36_13120 [Proteobacteria bacterium]|nr:hypothetical protein [Pseudomonadota bacterium]